MGQCSSPNSPSHVPVLSSSPPPQQPTPLPPVPPQQPTPLPPAVPPQPQAPRRPPSSITWPYRPCRSPCPTRRPTPRSRQPTRVRTPTWCRHPSSIRRQEHTPLVSHAHRVLLDDPKSRSP